MIVTLLYFDGCPHWTTADERLKAALRLAGRDDVEVDRRKVETAEDAEELGFIGSPTILIDGRDPFADPATPASLSCRLYQTPDGPAGAPAVEQLVEALS
jgi:hypothetical protein